MSFSALRLARLRPPVRAMVLLHWCYDLVGAMTGVFVQIYLYQEFASVAFNVQTLIIYFFSVIVGFSGVGALAGVYRMNMKWGYLAAFIALAGSFALLFGDVSRTDAVWFTVVNGFGLGLYWLTLHTFELTETRNDERDLYSSLLTAGGQVIDLAAPIAVTALFFLSERVFGLGAYTLLFAVSPFVYLAGVPLLGALRTYRPEPIDWHDVRHFFLDRRNRASQLYFFGGSASFALSRIAIPLAAITLLGTETRVGIVNAIFAAISAGVILFVARIRHPGNRMRFLFVTSILAALVTAIPAFWFALPAYLVYALGMVLLRPLQRTSAHVIDLETMETLGRKERDFFPTMVLRDVALGFWRIVSLAILAAVMAVAGEGEGAIRACFAVLALSYVVQYIGARMMTASSGAL